jgi:flagellar hook-basal body complex protein FliE
MNISLQSIPIPQLATTSTAASGSAAGGFADAISSAIGNVEGAQSQAQSAASQLLINGTGDVHTVALAAQSAELSLELFQQVRNKFVSAYQEIMKMPM